MNTKEAFEKRNRISRDFDRINKERNELYMLDDQLKRDCPHEVVVLFNDKNPRKKLIAGNCYCPACSRMIRVVKMEDLPKSIFGKSTVLDIRELSLIGDERTLMVIREDMYRNLDLYYGSMTDKMVLEGRLYDILADFEVKIDANTLRRQLK